MGRKRLKIKVYAFSFFWYLLKCESVSRKIYFVFWCLVSNVEVELKKLSTKLIVK